MKKTRNLISWSLFLVVFIFSCSSIESEKIVQYEIDVDRDHQDKHLLFSDFFESVTPIFLETQRECLIGSVNAIQVYNDKIFLLDGVQAKRLFVFDKEGRFLNAIGSIGKGPGEYLEILDFTINAKKDEVYALDGTRMHRYKVDGTYVGTIQFDVDQSNYTNIQYCYDNVYVDAHPYNSERDDFILKQFKATTGKLKHNLLSLSDNMGFNKLYSYGRECFLAKLDSEPKFIPLFSNIVYALTAEGVKPYTSIKCKEWVAEAYLKDIQKENSDPSALTRTFRNNNRAFTILKYIEQDSTILIQFAEGSRLPIVVFDKSNGTSKIFDEWIDDLTGSIWTTNLAFSDQSGIYTVIEPDLFSYLIEEIGKDKINKNMKGYDRIQQIDEEDNPIIFYYKFK